LDPDYWSSIEDLVDPDMFLPSKDKLAIFGYLMMQCSLKAVMRQFKGRAEDTATIKLTQLHVMDTWTPEDPTKLSRLDKIKALSSLMFFQGETRWAAQEQTLCRYIDHHNENTFQRRKQHLQQ